MKYARTQHGDIWEICEAGRDLACPASPCFTFAFDTETLTYLDGKVLDEKAIKRRTMRMSTANKRKRVSVRVWAWQCYTAENGFYMTNDFDTFLQYLARCRCHFGHCYNASFDFAQIDYKILAEGQGKWKQHEYAEKGKAYNKSQPWTYESLHNDMGARYSYKLWIPYRNKDRHTYVHAVQFQDFAKFCAGGLKSVLENLKVTDEDGNPIRKLTMEYQAVDENNLTDDEIAYCCNDVKGLYYAVKSLDKSIDEMTHGECRLFGKDTNIMTAGGLAKRELLRNLYPNVQPRFRLSRYQKDHPISKMQDKWLRDNHLYRGGISFINPAYKGKMWTAKEKGCPMYRYDVNSEYPYSMASIRDLVGKPFKMSIAKWLEMPQEEQDEYECIYVLKSASGHVKSGFLGLWYDPFKKKYTDIVEEEGTHLMFKREYDELANWYDLEISIDDVILFRRGDYVYKPFIDKYYRLKSESKKAGNATLTATAKLVLNSSYGKLAERAIRGKGHYELNSETGSIHFVSDGTEESDSTMSVAVGALVTSFARCYILRRIREICSPYPARDFVYIDTDSIHAFAYTNAVDDLELGALKLEMTCKAIKYIAPKTDVDIADYAEDGTIPLNAKGRINYELHSKGISHSAIESDIKKKQKGIRRGLPTLALFDRKMTYGVKYWVLCAMNVKGGKVLLPTLKYLARVEQAPDYDSEVSISKIEGTILTER